MKNKILFATLGLAVTFAVTGCDDEAFLTESPKTIYTVDNAFDKSSQVEAQLMRAYTAAYALHSWGVSAFGTPAAQTLAGYGADCNEGNAQTSGVSSAFSNYASLNALDSHFSSTWDALYQLASYSNLAIKGADQVTWTNEADKAALVAEGKFFTGWAYLRLAECFGGVPIVSEFSDLLRYDYTRATRQETYQFAIECLETAAKGLPAKTVHGRVNKDVANHYLAEAYINMGIETDNASWYTKAQEAAKSVIANHPLMTKRFGARANASDTGSMNNVPNYRPDGNVIYDLYQLGNYDLAENTEALWVMETPTYEQQSANGGQFYYLGVITGQPLRDLQWKDQYKTPGCNGPWGNPANIDTKKYTFGTGCSYLGGNTWGFVGVTDYVDEYIWQGEYSEDLRNSQVVLCDPIVLDQTSPWYGQTITPDMLLEPARYMRISAKVKMQDDWGWDAHHQLYGQPYLIQYGRDWYAARSAETYLLLAEAQMRAGDNAAAAETINTLRTRAQASKMLTADEININTLLDERARELNWEEHRWPTLLRLVKEGATNTIMQNQVSEHAMYQHDVPKYNPDIKGMSAPKWSLFPIPQSIIQLNSDAELKQNAGWE